MRFLNNDPKNKKPQDNKPQNGDDGRQGRRIIFLMVAALIATLLINSLYTTIANAYLSEITYNEFQDVSRQGSRSPSWSSSPTVWSS